MDKVFTSLTLAFLLFVSGTILAAPVSNDIKTDHFGYRPADTKIAIFSANPGSTVEIRDATNNVVFAIPANGGSIQSKGYDGQHSGDTVWWVNFSGFSTPGTYRLYSAALAGQSYDFDIAEDVYKEVVLTALRSFYLERCNTPKARAQFATVISDGLAVVG